MNEDQRQPRDDPDREAQDRPAERPAEPDRDRRPRHEELTAEERAELLRLREAMFPAED